MYNRRIYLRSRNLPSSLQKQNRKFGLFWSKNGKGDSHDEETITESTSFYQTGRSCSFASPRSSVTDHPTFEKWNEGIPKRYKFVQVKDFRKLGIHSDSGKKKGCGMYCNKNERCIVCPSCKGFVWHKMCFISLYEEFGLKTPNIESDDWSCPNCMK